MNNEILLAKDWLLNSGIQNTAGEVLGGFNSWFDLDTGRYPYVYSEITGYGITTLLFLDDLFEGDFIARAKLAADWLEKNALHECGGVRTRDYREKMTESDVYSFQSDNLYAFDNGMVLYGLINLYKKCKDKKYLDFSKKIAGLMLKEMRKEDGLFYAVYNPSTGKKEDSPRKWSSQSGSYHAKLAMGFVDLFEVTKEEKYKDAALTLCRSSISFQMEDGRFMTSRADESTHLHPHSYSAEGLLYTGMHLGHEDLVSSAEKGVKWALDNQCDDGGIPKKHGPSGCIPFYRSDSLAQILRLGVILKSIGKLEAKYDSRLERLKAKILSFQYKENGPQKGGFYYGFTLDGQRKEHINSWCGMFALQALIMFEDIYIKGNDIKRLECLI